MHFKVNPTGCGERKGLVEVRYDLYLDPNDYGYADHYVIVPDLPKEGYQGKDDPDAYEKWLKSLPTVSRVNPFCCHFVQFEDPNVTDEDILKRGDEVLAMAYRNWQEGNLRANKNPRVKFSSDPARISACQTRAEAVKTTDFAALDAARMQVE